MLHPSESPSTLWSSPWVTRWWRRLLPLVAHMLREDADLLTRWRARLTAAFLSAIATLGLVLAVPVVTVSVAKGLWPLVYFDFAALFGTYGLIFSRHVSNQVRSVFLTGASFGLGVVSVITRGPGSTVLGWLFMSTFLAAFLLGPRVTAGVVVATLSVLAGVAIGIAREWLPWAVNNPSALNEWLLTALNFAFLIVVFAVANGIIIRLLENEDRARVSAEQQLREARHNEALGTLAGGIAHDFNNLLVPVLANVEAVRAELPAGSEAHLALGDAERSALRARELVQRILTFGRGMNTERIPLDIVQAARDALHLSQIAAPPDVRLELHASSQPLVHASTTELHQILSNLIVNAVHAVGTRGQVEVVIDAVTRPSGPWVRLRVRDNGVGMDVHTRERLFDPYFSTKSAGRGTGLGLPIVQSIVLSLRGTVHVDSAPRIGTLFTVMLPAIANPDVAPAVVANAPPTGEPAELPAGVRVLLVDDEPSVRRAASRLLESLGCSVVGVASGAEALDQTQRQPAAYDVLVTDYRMPGMSGGELVGELQRTARAIPVVVISGHLDAARAEGQLDDGVVLLAKPFTRAAMANALATALAVR